MRLLLLDRPNLVLQTLVIGQQIVNGVFAEHTPLEVGGQQSCLIGLEVGPPVGTLVIGLQRGNVGLQLSEVLQSGFQSFDHLLALVKELNILQVARCIAIVERENNSVGKQFGVQIINGWHEYTIYIVCSALNVWQEQVKLRTSETTRGDDVEVGEIFLFGILQMHAKRLSGTCDHASDVVGCGDSAEWVAELCKENFEF